MTCHICGTKIVERMATSGSPYHYVLSGLKNIYLAGITIKKCIQCGTESPVIPKIEELHRLIARDLAEKPGLLTGEQVRYLRKMAGFSSKRFAALIELTPSHLSRFEHDGYKNLGAPTDKLVRALSMLSIDEEFVKKALLHIADGKLKAGRDIRKKSPTPIFSLNRNKWNRAA